MARSVLSNLSDTARWTAHYRAEESARPDALFSDPYAAGLAGERGRVIAEAARRSFGNGWFFIARTRIIDDFVAEALAAGCDRVVNLAAGLDTRPYRLDLPAGLEWVEVDLPELIEEKNAALAAETPRCELTRMAVDLTDGDARRECLRTATAGAAKALVITEGLLLYLDESEVRAIAADLATVPVAWWITDVIGPGVVALTARSAKRNNARLTFGPADGIAFFERAGWSVRSRRSQLPEAARWGRVSPVLRLLSRLPAPNPRRPGRAPWSAVLLLSR